MEAKSLGTFDFKTIDLQVPQIHVPDPQAPK